MLITIFRATFIFILTGINISTIEQKNNFELLLEQKSNNVSLTNKLKKFQSSGIERSLEIDTVKPEDIIEVAKTYLGTPHCMGGLSHRCIDCSGLLYVSFRELGIPIPRSSQSIAGYGKIILDIEDLKPGDLVFFVGTYRTSKAITHSGIYIGNDEFIHTSSRKGVVIANIKSDYYQRHYIFSTRVFPQNEKISMLGK